MQLDVEESTPAIVCNQMTFYFHSGIAIDNCHGFCKRKKLFIPQPPKKHVDWAIFIPPPQKKNLLTGQFFLECSGLTSLVNLGFALKNLQLFFPQKKHDDWANFF